MRRRLLVLANNVEEVGGVQRVAHLLGSGFEARGWEVELCGVTHADNPHDMAPGARYARSVLYDTPPPRGYFPKNTRERLNIKGDLRELRRRRMRAAAVQRLEEKLAWLDGGFVICMQVYAAEHLVEARRNGAHVIGQYHDSYAAAVSSGDLRRLQRTMPRVDAFALLTAEDARLFRRAGHNNTRVMHNPLTFRPHGRADLSAPAVVSLGRYHQQKALDRMIDAWALIAPSLPGWTLRLFGSGPLEAELAAQIARLELSSSVRLEGPTADVEGALMASSVYALSSRHEGLPMVLTEAMSCGVPCVAMDCAPGIREIITDGVDGLVTPNNDVAALADGILRLASDPALRRTLADAAVSSVERFSTDRVLDEWERLFAQVAR